MHCGAAHLHAQVTQRMLQLQCRLVRHEILKCTHAKCVPTGHRRSQASSEVHQRAIYQRYVKCPEAECSVRLARLFQREKPQMLKHHSASYS